MSIKAIETKAFGHRFRSRLEARWALFFEEMEMGWEYEPEGFEIDGICYLPDFRVWTPFCKPIWYEVKPKTVLHDHKFSAFRHALAQQAGVSELNEVRAQLLSGDPFHNAFEQFRGSNCGYKGAAPCPRCNYMTPYVPAGAYVDDDHGCGEYFQSICVPCSTECDDWNGWIGFIVSDYDEDDAIHKVRRAAELARSARFT
jgi:hypothetical protein